METDSEVPDMMRLVVCEMLLMMQGIGRTLVLQSEIGASPSRGRYQSFVIDITCKA